MCLSPEIWTYLHFSLVHEVEEKAKIFLPNVPQDHNWVGARVALRRREIILISPHCAAKWPIFGVTSKY